MEHSVLLVILPVVVMEVVLGDSSTQHPTLQSWPSIWLFTWQGLETSSWSSSRALDRPTLHWHRICSCQPLGHGGDWSNTTARAGYAMTMTTLVVAAAAVTGAGKWLRKNLYFLLIKT